MLIHRTLPGLTEAFSVSVPAALWKYGPVAANGEFSSIQAGAESNYTYARAVFMSADRTRVNFSARYPTNAGVVLCHIP